MAQQQNNETGARSRGYINVPNALTLARLLMIVPMVGYFMAGRPLRSLFFFLLASLTDLLDGYIARKYNQISNFGKVMDPLADKLMLLAATLCLFRSGELPLPVIIIVFCKEILMILGGILLYRIRHAIVPANIIGKIGTVLYFVAVVLAFLSAYTSPWYLYLFYAAVAFSLFSIVQYAILVWRQFAKPA